MSEDEVRSQVHGNSTAITSNKGQEWYEPRALRLDEGFGNVQQSRRSDNGCSVVFLEVASAVEPDTVSSSRNKAPNRERTKGSTKKPKDRESKTKHAVLRQAK